MFSSCCGCTNKKSKEKITENSDNKHENLIIVTNDEKDNLNENNDCVKSVSVTGNNKEEDTIKDVEASNDVNLKLENGNSSIKKNRLCSEASNITIEETIQLQPNNKLINNTVVPDNELDVELPNCQLDEIIDNTNRDNDDTDDDLSKDCYRDSCTSQRTSSKSSMKKRSKYNDSTEAMPPSEISLNSIYDDDEVFSDSIQPILPRGNMCTPFLKKRGSMPGLVALPDWFGSEHDREFGGLLEPPVTPIGRDELALKRHRFFADLLTAAQAAAEHRVRFDPLGPVVAGEDDCDPSFKPSTSSDLEHLVVRLEKIVDRLERTVSARELEFVNQALTSVISTVSTIEKRDFESPPLPSPPAEFYQDLTEKLEKKVNTLETSINSFIDIQPEEYFHQEIPTVVTQIYLDNNSINMSVNAYQDIISDNLTKFLNLSVKIGGDVAQQAAYVKKAFDAQLQYVTLATTSAQPPQARQMELLKPTSENISAIQEFREKHRTSPFFNHLSAISESIPALGWVCVAPTPGPHVKEMNDAGQFYTNRVLKDWKEKDSTHVEWARSWVQTLTELQKFIKQYHTTGLVWSGKSVSVGSGPPPPPPGGMPPPPPMIPFGDLSIGGADDGLERNALFAEINKGQDITNRLKKVTPDMQTHKNTTLRTGPAPFKAPTGFKPQTAPKPFAAVDKPPVFVKDGKKWLVEYQKNKTDLLVDNAEMNNVVYMFKCQDSTITIKGKINSIVIDSCKKCSILLDSLVSSIEFVNCQSVQMQVLGIVPIISIDKTDGCQMYLSKESIGVEIISSKSSEMNVMIPTGNGDYTEQPIPEQFRTMINGTSLKTTCVESLG